MLHGGGERARSSRGKAARRSPTPRRNWAGWRQNCRARRRSPRCRRAAAGRRLPTGAAAARPASTCARVNARFEPVSPSGTGNTFMRLRASRRASTRRMPASRARLRQDRRRSRHARREFRREGDGNHTLQSSEAPRPLMLRRSAERVQPSGRLPHPRFHRRVRSPGRGRTLADTADTRETSPRSLIQRSFSSTSAGTGLQWPPRRHWMGVRFCEHVGLPGTPAHSAPGNRRSP